MLLTILFLSTIIQLLISHTDKCLLLLLKLSRISFFKKYIPRLNIFLEFYVPQPIDTPRFNSETVFSSCNPSDLSDTIQKMNKKEDGPKTFAVILKKYEEENNTKVIMIDHKKTDGMYGLSFLGSQETLTMEDSKKFVDIMRNIDENTNLTLILNTPGGLLSAAEVIVHSLLSHKGKITTYIPYYSMSAGTLISLVSDEIVMDKNAYCGPIDPQLWVLSSNDIIKYGRESSNDSNGIIKEITRLLCKKAELSINRIDNVLKEIKTKNDGYDIDKISEELLHGKYNHDQPLFAKNMNDILPNVVIGIPSDVMKLYNYSNGNCSTF